MRRITMLVCTGLLATGLHAAEPAAGNAAAAAPAGVPASEAVPQADRGNPPAPPAGPRARAQAADGQQQAARPPASAAAPGNADHIELESTQITGNAELPRVMYVVPWKRPELGELGGRPVKSLLDEVLEPVDRDVFRRQNRYYEALRPDGTRGGQ